MRDNSSGDDNGNTKENGNHNGNGKGDNGKHLGWYKKAQKPKFHGKSPNTSDNSIYEVTNYINDVNQENPQVLMTSDENGTFTSAYTYGLDRISVSTLGITDDKYTPLYYQYDGRGSVTGLVGNADNIEARYSYDAFGVPKPGIKLDTKENGFINSYGFNGEENDTYSGLQYLRARYYESDTGRFLSRDSYLGDLMNPLTLNRYDYTINNPLIYSDPSGHSLESNSPSGGSYTSGDTLSPDKMDADLINYSKITSRAQQLVQSTKLTGSLQMGSSGNDVRAAQQYLIDLGYLGSNGADGIFGNITKQSVQVFQKDNHLTVDGIVGPQTLAALQAAKVGKVASVQFAANSDKKSNCGGSHGTGKTAVAVQTPETNKNWFDKAKDAVVNTANDIYYKATEFQFEKRDALNEPHPSYSDVNSRNSSWVLLPPAMSVEHNNGIGKPELKYINPDGREAVFDGDTLQLITDPRYKGTYNYVTPALPPENKINVIGWGEFIVKGAGHLITDWFPYKILGSKNERNQ